MLVEVLKILMSKLCIVFCIVLMIENGDGSYEGVWGFIFGNGVDLFEWVQCFVLLQFFGMVMEVVVCFLSDNGGFFDFEFFIFLVNGNCLGNEFDCISFCMLQFDVFVVECLQLFEINFLMMMDCYFFGVQFSVNDDFFVLVDENSFEQ